MKKVPARLTIIGVICAVLSALPVQSREGGDSGDVKITLAEAFNRFATSTLDSVAVTGIPSDDHRAALDSLVLSREGGPLNEGLVAHDTRALTDYLRKGGWWNARVSASVDSLPDSGLMLTLAVDSGNPVFFGEITIETDEDAAGLDPSITAESRGRLFAHSFLEAVIQEMITHASARGYPAVVVTPLLSAREDTVNVTLVLDHGARAYIDSIAVYGLTRTKDYIIRRELAGLLGMEADLAATEYARTTIGRLAFIHLVQEPRLDYTDDSRCILAVEVTEGKQGSFDGAVGYQPGAEGTSGEMVGKIDLEFPNILGTGRATNINWENLGKDTEDLAVEYTEPWIFGTPYNVSGSFSQEQRENLDFTRTTIRSVVRRTVGSFNAGGGYRYEKVSSDSLNSSSAHGIDVTLSWNELDRRENPRTGFLYSIRWSQVSKRYRFGKKPSHRLSRLEFDLDHYIPVFGNQALALLLRYRHVDTPNDKLTLSDRYWLGGATSLRGYREEMFPVVRALWGTFEYRLLRGRSSRIFAFVDSGYLTNVASASNGGYEKKTINRTGYGIGMRIESAAGMLGFDYGLGKGDGLGDGKVHVGLSSNF